MLLLFGDASSAPPLKSEHLMWLFLAQLAFGAALAVALAVYLKERLFQLFDRSRGPLLLKILTIFFVCTITGNLALVGLLEPAAATPLFGAVLGYVFGVALPPGKQPKQPPEGGPGHPEQEPKPPEPSGEPP
jgi:hypothetical protein